MKAAIIIPVTRPNHVIACLDRLLQQTFAHSEFEIILIKNTGTVLTWPVTDVKITEIEEVKSHPGFRRNCAVKRTDAEILAFLDDDTVPQLDWLFKAIFYIEKENIDGVCGPLLQSQNNSSLGNILAGAANESVFLEGFEDCNLCEKKPAKFYNIPLCNAIIKRAVWESVGGFNEMANYYIDDIEFFYLACKKGFKFYNIPDIALYHSVEPFPLRYLRKKFETRFYTGMNSLMFHEVYGAVPFIRLAFLIYPVLMLSIFLVAANKWPHSMLFLIIYVGLAIWHSRSVFAKSKMAFICLPTVFFLTHAVNFTAFTFGMVFFIIKRKKFAAVIEHKKGRLPHAGIA